MALRTPIRIVAGSVKYLPSLVTVVFEDSVVLLEIIGC